MLWRIFYSLRCGAGDFFYKHRFKFLLALLFIAAVCALAGLNAAKIEEAEHYLHENKFNAVLLCVGHSGAQEYFFVRFVCVFCALAAIFLLCHNRICACIGFLAPIVICYIDCFSIIIIIRGIGVAAAPLVFIALVPAALFFSAALFVYSMCIFEDCRTACFYKARLLNQIKPCLIICAFLLAAAVLEAVLCGILAGGIVL